MFFTTKNVAIITGVTAIIGTVFGLISLIDQIKNGDRRASISGTATGRAITRWLEKNNKKEEKVEA